MRRWVVFSYFELRRQKKTEGISGCQKIVEDSMVWALGVKKLQ